MEFVATDRLLLRAAMPEGGPSQPASRRAEVDLGHGDARHTRQVPRGPRSWPPGPQRAPPEQAPIPARSPPPARSVPTAPRRVVSASRARDVAAFAIGPIAFPAPAPHAPLTRLFATPV